MSHTSHLIQRAVQLRASVSPSSPRYSDASSVQEVPTLDPNVRRHASPMLYERFLFCGKWEMATHGDWLSITEMTAIAENDLSDPRIAEIADGVRASALDWANDAAGLFRPDRLSLFAASDTTYERVYLVWFDEVEEPELWVYDANGEGRYGDLDEYLETYMSGQLFPYERQWRIAETK